MRRIRPGHRLFRCDLRHGIRVRPGLRQHRIAGRELEFSNVSGPILLLSLAIGFLLARRAFAPVAEMRRQLHAITARNLTARVRIGDADGEFRAIESAINALLKRLETTFDQWSEHSAQVAHEIRTPLTLLRLQIEDAAGRIEPELAESLQEELARLSDYAEQSLLLATAEQGRLKRAAETVELRDLISDILGSFKLLARSEGRAVVFAASRPVAVNNDPHHLRQIFHNLLANAIEHGSWTIALTLACRSNGASCRIENERPAASHRRHNWRGLGLRIVRAIAASEGLVFSTSDQPGSKFCASLEFPTGILIDLPVPVKRSRDEPGDGCKADGVPPGSG